MPIIKSAIKRARQNDIRQKRLQPYKSHMKTMMKKFVAFVEDKDEKKAIALMPNVYKSIDTAAKKKIINPKTAARRKSKMARMLTKPDTTKTKTAKPAATKKVAKKKETAKADAGK
jgi:small subunit ribosomal protein S20